MKRVSRSIDFYFIVSLINIIQYYIRVTLNIKIRSNDSDLERAKTSKRPNIAQYRPNIAQTSIQPSPQHRTKYTSIFALF